MLEGNKTKWVDVSKGIVICLMVIGHSSMPQWLSRWIWSFHMPFFFIISALFTSWGKSGSRYFIERKAKTLLYPFIVYCIINLILYPISLDIPFVEYTKKILLGGWGGVALWFVPVFFVSIVITRIIPKNYLVITSVILAVIGVSLCHFRIFVPWTMSSVPFCASMMMIVRYFQKRLRTYFSHVRLHSLIINFVLGGTVSLVISHYYQLDLATNTILPVIPLSLGIVAGCDMAISLSILLSNYCKRIADIFTHIGRNTYEIMALSQIIIITINNFLPMPVPIKYLVLIATLTGAVFLRKAIEGKMANNEAI